MVGNTIPYSQTIEKLGQVGAAEAYLTENSILTRRSVYNFRSLCSLAVVNNSANVILKCPKWYIARSFFLRNFA